MTGIPADDASHRAKEHPSFSSDDSATLTSAAILRVLVLTLEFTYSPFSGNGLYGRSVVRSLLRTGRCEVVVCCARPAAAARPMTPNPTDRSSARSASIRRSASELSADHHLTEPELTAEQAARLRLWPVDLPPGAPWKKLDEGGPWREFARGAAERYAERVAGTISAGGNSDGWKPDVVLVVDWHGGAAWRAIVAKSSSLAALPKVCYFNFRVYSSGLCPTKADWYEEKERQALEMASDVVCLSRPDMKSLQRLLSKNGEMKQEEDTEVALLHPSLRGDMHSLAEALAESDLDALEVIRQSLPPAAAAALREPNVDSNDNRRFVACAVRLSKEKNPLFYVEMMEGLCDTLSELGIVPLLCGAASEEDYAKECRERLLRAYPHAVVIGDFLGPEQLASIFAHSVLNVHPCRYDAYGMTVVEAAAFGVPSIINCRDVGATELLREDGYLPLDMKMTKEESVATIRNILLDPDRLSKVKKTAYERAVGWSEDASGKVILERLRALVL